MCQRAPYQCAGCGEAPEGVELAMKLMVPGEVALVGVRGGTQYGYR